VAQSHTKGTTVTVWTFVGFKGLSEYIGSVLQRLGYPIRVQVIGGNDFFAFYHYVTDSKNRAQAAGYWNVVPDPSSSELPALTRCDSFTRNDPNNLNTAEFCDPTIDTRIDEARAKLATDPARPRGSGRRWIGPSSTRRRSSRP
jgi:hypothetical protein